MAQTHNALNHAVASAVRTLGVYPVTECLSSAFTMERNANLLDHVRRRQTPFLCLRVEVIVAFSWTETLQIDGATFS